MARTEQMKPGAEHLSNRAFSIAYGAQAMEGLPEQERASINTPETPDGIISRLQIALSAISDQREKEIGTIEDCLVITQVEVDLALADAKHLDDADPEKNAEITRLLKSIFEMIDQVIKTRKDEAKDTSILGLEAKVAGHPLGDAVISVGNELLTFQGPERIRVDSLALSYKALLYLAQKCMESSDFIFAKDINDALQIPRPDERKKYGLGGKIAGAFRTLSPNLPVKIVTQMIPNKSTDGKSFTKSSTVGYRLELNEKS
ncbi:MAG: hypothetical protein AAB373_01185 [Patescibacteria group bacterium]